MGTNILVFVTCGDKHVDAMASHYGTNIRAVGAKATVEAARRAILSTYHHARSTDVHPQHHYFPAGYKSWCWVKRAEFKNGAAAPHTEKTLYLAKLDPTLRRHVF